jgi:stage III sporulation protein AE
MFMSIQGMTAGMYDGITLRVTKYAIGNSVPIVGGFLRDGVDLFLAAGLLVKNALGLFGVVFIVGIFLSPIVELITFMFFLKLSAGLIEPFTDSKISDYMFSIAKNLNYVLASVLVVCFMYLVTIILIICAGGAMV